VRITRRFFLKQTALASTLCLPMACQSARVVATDPGVTTVPLQESMKRAADCCLAWLNPAYRFLPEGGYEIAHDTGRWWDAMLRYEACTGERIPANFEDSMLANAKEMTQNRVALLTNIFGPPESAVINPHNFRESMQTYTLLVKYRKNEWALEQGKTMVQALISLLDDDGQMNYERLIEMMDGLPLTGDPMMRPLAAPGEWFDSTPTTGRAIEPIVQFHDATGYAPAMELAERLCEIHFKQIIEPDGELCEEIRSGKQRSHNHSYNGMLRGMLLFGRKTHNKKYIDAVLKTYRNSVLRHSITESGYAPHDLGLFLFVNEHGDPIGEHSSPADIMQIALWLAQHTKDAALYNDIERILRARLLPSQINNPDVPRDHGAWGCYAHPYDFASILDVFAAVLHALTEVSKGATSQAEDKTLSVHLHFDCDLPELALRSQRGEEATVTITPKVKNALRIRVPDWATRSSVSLTQNSDSIPLVWDGSYLVIPRNKVKLGRAITLKHDLPARETVEETPVAKIPYKLFWKGDTIVGSSPAVPIYSA